MDVLPPDGMQEVRSSNLLSSTWSEVKFEQIEQGSTGAKYRNGGPVGRRTCVRIDMAPLARAAGKAADFSHRSAADKRATWANSRSSGVCDTCRLAVIWLVRAVSRAVTVAVFAGGLRPTVRCIPKVHSRPPEEAA